MCSAEVALTNDSHLVLEWSDANHGGDEIWPCGGKFHCNTNASHGKVSTLDCRAKGQE
jgi:hypothetical protein